MPFGARPFSTDYCTVSGARKGAHAPQKSRVSASLRSIPPLPLRNGQALDFFHPALKKQVSGFLRKPCFSFFFILCTSLFEAEPPRNLPLCLFCFAGARSLKAGGADSVKPQALRVTSYRRSGLTESAPPAFRERAPAKQKRQRGRFRGGSASNSEVQRIKKNEKQGFRRKPDTCFF